MRSGSEYIASLRDGRPIYLDGERVEDVTKHPAFIEPIRRVAATYDRARDASVRDSLSYADRETGQTFSAMWLIPRSADDLAARRRLHRFWAEGSYGLMGRTPDHVACTLTAFAASPQFFARGGARFAENIVRFYQKARADDLYIAYVIVPPQVDRSQPAHKQPEPFLYVGAAKERDDGIVVRGAQMIGTSAALADYILVTYITPLQAGDEDYALNFVIPANAQGLRIYPRRPYATLANSVYDYPLSSRFDEVDSLIVLNDVFVPWEHLFVYRNVGLINAQFNEIPSHVLANFQSLVRFSVKLEFAAGLAWRLAEIHNIHTMPPVQSQLGGDVAVLAAMMESLVHAAATQPLVRDGVAWPSPQFIYAGMSLQRRLVVDFMRTLRELAGGAFLAVPSSVRSFESEATQADTRRYFRSATASAEERVKLLKLIWDFVGTEFGGRQLQYEMFYSAAQHVVNARMYRAYDWERARTFVDRCLNEY